MYDAFGSEGCPVVRFRNLVSWVLLTGCLAQNVWAGPGDSEAACVKGYLKKRVEWLDDRLTNRSVWDFPPEVEARLQAIAADTSLTPEEQGQALFQEVVEARLRAAHPLTLHFMRNTVLQAQDQKGIYAATIGNFLSSKIGPHYFAPTNRVGYRPRGNSHVRDLTLLIHELEHAYHRNSQPLMWLLFAKVNAAEISFMISTPFAGFMRRNFETRAIGAQWELLNRMPEERRAQWMKRIALERALIKRAYKLRKKSVEERKAALDIERDFANREEKIDQNASDLTPELRAKVKADLFAERDYLLQLVHDEKFWKMADKQGKREDDFLEISYQSLRHAHLSKEEFIEKLSPVHGYTLSEIVKDHVGPFNQWKLMILMASLPVVIDAVTKGKDPEAVFFKDLRFVLRLYIQLMFDDQAELAPSAK